jgi:hypothetical protein
LQKPYEIEVLVSTIHQVMQNGVFREERTQIGGGLR